MSTDLEHYFKEELLAIEEVNVIYSGSYWQKWDKEIARIGEKHLGEGNFPEFSVWGAGSSKSSCTSKSSSECCTSSQSCTSKSHDKSKSSFLIE